MRLVVGLTLSACAVCAQAQSFAADKRLAAPITMRVKIESLSAFTADLTKLTKVHFATTTAIADRKITAICKDRPAREVLQAVTDAMFMAWKKDGAGYMLVMSADAQRDEEAAIKADQEAIRSGVVAGLKGFVAAAAMSSEDKAKKASEIGNQIKALRAATEQNPGNQIAELAQERIFLSSNSGQGIASAYSANLDAAADSMLAGQTLCASTRSTDGCPVLPSDYLDKINSRPTSPGGHHAEAAGALVIMRVNESDQSLFGQAILAPGAGVRRGNSMSDFFFCRPAFAGSDADKTKLAKRMMGWASGAEPAVLGKAIDTTTPAVTGSPYTLADNLEYISDHAGIPVIGDAFRLYCSRGAFSTSKTVGDYVAALTKPVNPGSLTQPSVGYYTAQHGWLLIRHMRYWNRLATEVPESALRPMEQSAKEKGIPTLAEYANFAAGMSAAQANSFIFDPSLLAVNFDTFPFQPAICSLRLYATLSEPQVAGLQQGSLKLSTLSADQRHVVMDCLAASMWRGSLPISLWPAALSPKGLNFDGIELRCRVSAYPPGADGQRPPQSEIKQDEAYFTYAFGSGQQFTEMYIARKTFRRTDGPDQ